jgi:hypothetical protein
MSVVREISVATYVDLVKNIYLNVNNAFFGADSLTPDADILLNLDQKAKANFFFKNRLVGRYGFLSPYKGHSFSAFGDNFSLKVYGSTNSSSTDPIRI